MKFFPVTDSTLNAEHLNEFINERYSLGLGFSCSLFRTGINDTYFLSNGKTKYVARVYSCNWRSELEVLEELVLVNSLYEEGLSVSHAIPDKEYGFSQTINAPEGLRFLVLFSFAEGDKIRSLSRKMCADAATLMAKMHQQTENHTLERTSYDVHTLLQKPRDYTRIHFSESLEEMVYLKELSTEIQHVFKALDAKSWKKGNVHMDIWYDNFSVADNGKITLFDFDFCGNGWFVLDVAYFCSQLYHIETDKEHYKIKRDAFLEAYQKIIPLSQNELKAIPYVGAAVWMFYLGVQAKRFDWSNIFLTQNYLKMYTGRIKSWLDFAKS